MWGGVACRPLTGGCRLPDNHDVVSMKLYQLMVEHSPEEEEQDWSQIQPGVSLLKSPKGGSEGREEGGRGRGWAGPGWAGLTIPPSRQTTSTTPPGTSGERR